MKVCEIVNDNSLNVLGHLFYFERQDLYLIKLDELCQSEELPLYLSLLKDLGLNLIGPDYSRKFVESRIVPRDRQNLGSILRKYKLKNYDTYKLLIISSGRCAQDDCSIKEMQEYINLEPKILTTTRLNNEEILVELSDGRFLKNNLSNTIKNNDKLECFKLSELMNYKLLPMGLGIYWDEDKYILINELINNSSKTEFNSLYLDKYLSENIISTTEVAEILNCSRQYINTLVNKGTLKVLKESGNNRIFKRSDVEKLLW